MVKAQAGIFDREYKKLNPAQKEAVDSIEGPVMVVAGPGTGKTQILALRIGNILLKTDTPADGILCLTFTNSAVQAMERRLNDYIGSRAGRVAVSTFHKFALSLVEEHYSLLGFDSEPKILSDEEAVFLVDQILEENDWKYLRPRANPEMYFSDIKQLISILKRERLTPSEFLSEIEADVKNLEKSPDNISSRGENKGKLKKEVGKKIESLERTREVVEFYRLYEEKKFSMSLLDYDDVLEYAVRLVENYEDIRADIYENFQYVLVDEHQDSSGVQNNFLKAVWGDVERPNVFVVGDDRQLIYAFSGASFSYFEEFSHIFGQTKLITLTENYRSAASILSLADDLLQSSLAGEKLKSNLKQKGKIYLKEYTYPRDEIIGAGLYFREKIKSGVKPEECALLVPRNYQVRDALKILKNMGLKVSAGRNVSLFDAPETQSLLLILSIVADPYNSVLLSESLLQKESQIGALLAHRFLRNTRPDKLTIEEMKSSNTSLFAEDNAVARWGGKLERFVNDLSDKGITEVVSLIGNEILVDQAKNHDELIRNVEIVRSLLEAALLFRAKNPKAGLALFLAYLKRLESYGSHVSLAAFESDSGIQAMTLHKSKGLEYQAVWIAHMNEKVLMSEKKMAFTLPEKVKEHIREKDILSVKRELYVAITRAREDCVISYAGENYQGGELALAGIIKNLPPWHFIRRDKTETEKEILSFSPVAYVPRESPSGADSLEELRDFVRENYPGTKISVTLLNNFFECPWKWYFRNFLRLPELKTKSLALGSAVHRAIEFILKSKSFSKISIEGNIKAVLEKEGISSLAETRKLIKDGKRAVMRFVQDFYKNLAKDYIPERPLQFKDKKFPHLLIYGRIDLTERFPSGNVIITDFKTGSGKSKNVIEKLDKESRLSSHLRQLAMYSYLLAGAERGQEVSESRLLYLEMPKNDKNALYSTHISGEQIDLLVKDIKDYDQLLKSGEWTTRPCNYNSYGHARGRAGKNTECEYCQLAEIYK